MDREVMASLFRRVFNGHRNIMTPTLVEFIDTGVYVVELSKGDFLKRPLFGVTVLTYGGGKTKLDKSFQSEATAREYIEEM